MPRGGHKVRPVKVAQADISASPDVSGRVPTIEKIKRTNTEWKSSILASGFLSRSSTTTKFPDPISDQPPTPTVPDTSREWTSNLDIPIHSAEFSLQSSDARSQDIIPENPSNESEHFVRPRLESTAEEGDDEEREQDSYQADLDTFGFPSTESTLSNASTSIYSRSSASVYSRASSIYSSGASVYSFEDGGLSDFDRYRKETAEQLAAQPDLNSGVANVLRLQQAARAVALRQKEAQDAAFRERSTLAKKAALFKNSRLPPQLPSFSTSLPTWSMVCRAAKASQECYDSQAAIRRGTYFPADSSKDIKAMIVDDMLIDDSRLIIVSIRGTQSQSLSDWTVNTTATAIKPTGFLDNEENACHAGFMRVARAMINHVAAQLRQYADLPEAERPMLLFTGHSAGGAIAAMLYSHMTSITVESDLTALTTHFSKINCMTFGAPPVSQTPLLRRDHVPGIFLAFANEGDLVLRTSNAAYFKSLAKLMTASPPPSTAPVVAPAPVKVVRGSRGAAVYRQPVAAPPPTPWEDLPLWPTPAPSLTNAGDIILLRDKSENGLAIGPATASSIISEDLRDVIFGDLAQHTSEMYLRRVKELALSAMMGREL